MTNHSELAERVCDWFEDANEEYGVHVALIGVLHERILAAIDEAVRDEREACIKAIHEIFYQREPVTGAWRVPEKYAVEAIRARGNGESQ